MMRSSRSAIVTCLAAVALTSSYCPTGSLAAAAVAVETEEGSYGVDVSFPIHHRVSTNYDYLPHNVDPAHNEVPDEFKDMPVQPLGDRQAVYVKHVDSCRKYFQREGSNCDIYEYDRILMSQRQPQSMQNYTDIGFKKIRAPERVAKLISAFWEKNHLSQTMENWGSGNTYTNHWESPTYMVSVDDRGLRGSGTALKTAIWDAARDTIEEWTEEEISPTSLYGIRVYTEGAILLPHVDRLPLVASAMLLVAQDVDENWITEIYDHDGRAHNVTLTPGDMLLFESHSCLHGRPFPLKGRYSAWMYIHFEPIGHSLRHSGEDPESDVDGQYKQHTQDGHGGQAAYDGGLPPYITRESPEEAHWRQQHPEGWKTPARSPASNKQDLRVHHAASKGDVKELSEVISDKKELVRDRDENGWQPLHEAARGGHKEAIELLVKNGADVNTRTLGGRGGTALYIAKRKFGAFHPVVQYLKSLGGLDVPPDRSEL